MIVLGDIFPVKHFAEAMLRSFYGGPPAPVRVVGLLVVGGWGVVGLRRGPLLLVGAAQVRQQDPRTA